MERRRFVGWAGRALAFPALSLALPALSLAQQPDRVYRLGVMGFGELEAVRKALRLFLGALAQAGFTEGSNLQIELRVAPGESLPLDAVAAELVAAQPDAIFVPSNPGAAALKRATSAIPIVLVTGGDPVALGLIESFARPGGNLTGVTSLSTEAGNKRVELVKEVFPATRRIHYMNQKTNRHFSEEHRRHAQKLGMAQDFAVVENARDLDTFFARAFGPDEVISVGLSQTNFAMREAIVARANAARVPAIYPFLEAVEAGGLIAYAADLRDVVGRAMQMIARILKGARPAEIPFEQATRLSLAINQKTARALGITIPQVVLLRADRVIE
jgi:putative ABC transport system substrate-binding protein